MPDKDAIEAAGQAAAHGASGALGAVLAFVGKYGWDALRKGGSLKRLRDEVVTLQGTIGEIQVAQATILAKMMTKDDLVQMTEKNQATIMDVSKNLSAAFGAGIQHAHERIDELYKKAS